MADEPKQAEEIDGVLEHEGKQYISIDDFNKLKTDIETIKSINVGNEKKKTSMSKEIEDRNTKIEELTNMISNTQKETETKEEKMEREFSELKEQVAKSNLEATLAKKESSVKDIMSEFNLKTKADFALLSLANDDAEIRTLAEEQSAYYESIRAEARKGVANGSTPVKGSTTEGNPYEKLNISELNKLAIDQPELEDEIIKEVESRPVKN